MSFYWLLTLLATHAVASQNQRCCYKGKCADLRPQDIYPYSNIAHDFTTLCPHLGFHLRYINDLHCPLDKAVRKDWWGLQGKDFYMHYVDDQNYHYRKRDTRAAAQHFQGIHGDLCDALQQKGLQHMVCRVYTWTFSYFYCIFTKTPTGPDFE